MASIIKVDQIQTAAGGTPTAADLGINTSGTVLQVVQEIKTAPQVISTATSWTSFLTASITPKSTDSKILVHVSVSVGKENNHSGLFRVYRDSTFIGGGVDTLPNHWDGVWFTVRDSNPYYMENYSAQHLDSPATTSAITYSIRALTTNAGYPVYINRTRNNSDTGYDSPAPSIITLTEIAG